ncbi:hypothetical protein, partial [Holdemania filiformis]|uniref:hypothetical protein n=1 Tax=Holdemania filiformis TaxID=61171 RepID=UPI00242C67EA
SVICGDFIVTEILTYVSFFMLKKKRRWFPPTPKFIEPFSLSIYGSESLNYFQNSLNEWHSMLNYDKIMRN